MDLKVHTAQQMNGCNKYMTASSRAKGCYQNAEGMIVVPSAYKDYRSVRLNE